MRVRVRVRVLRFVNSEVDFAPPPLNALLRALHDEPPELRAAWWGDIAET